MALKVSSSVIETIGKTPTVRLNHLPPDVRAQILLKCEFRNPCLNIKDRVAMSMINAAINDGSLKPGGIIIEPTSGNTGIGLASIARAMGFSCVLVMPETMSLERRTLLKMLGAELILTPGPLGMKGAIAKTRQLLDEYGEKSFSPQQFDNPANPEIHYRTTGPEIWEATGGNIDAFVACVGTGGTVSGVGRFLKEQNPGIKIIAVEPENSAVISGKSPGVHKIQGTGAGFIPGNLDLNILDEVLTVSDDDAIDTARRLIDDEGILAGISSGANVHAAQQLGRRPEFEGKTIVTVAPSSTERYLSTILASEAKAEAMELPVSTIPDQYLK